MFSSNFLRTGYISFPKLKLTKIRATNSIPSPAIEPEPQISYQARKAEAVKRARMRARKECIGILNKCAVFGRMDKAADFIASGISPYQAGRRLMRERDKALHKEERVNRVSNRQSVNARSSGLISDMKRQVKSLKADEHSGGLASDMKRQIEGLGVSHG
jgi:hypothetical protein